jgi:hypothetical protein
MELHDERQIDDYTSIRRVPNGWIYMTDLHNERDDQLTSVFVPE